VEFALEQIEVVPLIVPATGAAVIVMLILETEVQPFAVAEYFIVSTPAPTPETTRVPVLKVDIAPAAV
jgi:hypothetical protein